MDFLGAWGNVLHAFESRYCAINTHSFRNLEDWYMNIVYSLVYASGNRSLLKEKKINSSGKERQN